MGQSLGTFDFGDLCDSVDCPVSPGRHMLTFQIDIAEFPVTPVSWLHANRPRLWMDGMERLLPIHRCASSADYPLL